VYCPDTSKLPALQILFNAIQSNRQTSRKRPAKLNPDDFYPVTVHNAGQGSNQSLRKIFSPRHNKRASPVKASVLSNTA
jgi:hypothetical protein